MQDEEWVVRDPGPRSGQSAVAELPYLLQNQWGYQFLIIGLVFPRTQNVMRYLRLGR